jgi:hypothetical protein
LPTTLLASRTEKAPPRRSRGATHRPGRGGSESEPIAMPESEPDLAKDTVAAWLSKAARFSPALTAFGGNESLHEAVDRLPVLWHIAYFFSTLVRFCTFLTRSLSVSVAATRCTTHIAGGSRDSDDCDDGEDCGTDVTGDATMWPHRRVRLRRTGR